MFAARFAFFIGFLTAVFSVAIPRAGFALDRQTLKSMGFESLEQRAPSLTLLDEKGSAVGLEKFKGKTVFLHLWATWCEPCRKEIPELASFAAKLKNSDVVTVFAAVDGEGDRSKVDKFLAPVTPKVTAYIVKETPDSKKYYAWGIPVTYLIDPSGKIVARAMGCRDWKSLSEDKVRSLVSK